MTHPDASGMVEALARRGLTLACAESLTGGLLSDTFVSVPGASRGFLGGVVAYHEAAKAALLGVPEYVLAHDGAVSALCALHMALGIKAALGADIALSATGYAGPEGADVGLVYIGYAGPDDADAFEYRFTGDRQTIRRDAAQAAVKLLSARLAAFK